MDISVASTDSKQLFYQLTKRQITHHGLWPRLHFLQLNGWADYIVKLSTAESLPSIDEDHHRAVQLTLHKVAIDVDEW